MWNFFAYYLGNTAFLYLKHVLFPVEFYFCFLQHSIYVHFFVYLCSTTGKKKDTWFTLDPQTGERNQVAGWENFSPKCPIKSNNAIYVGRTKYSILMVDTKTPQRKWNITFYDYRASPMTKDEMNSYGNVFLMLFFVCL